MTTNGTKTTGVWIRWTIGLLTAFTLGATTAGQWVGTVNNHIDDKQIHKEREAREEFVRSIVSKEFLPAINAQYEEINRRLKGLEKANGIDTGD